MNPGTIQGVQLLVPSVITDRQFKLSSGTCDLASLIKQGGTPEKENVPFYLCFVLHGLASP